MFSKSSCCLFRFSRDSFIFCASSTSSEFFAGVGDDIEGAAKSLFIRGSNDIY